ncbi:MAG: DUF6228 family protein [Gammaproteobacteria bacterium]
MEFSIRSASSSQQMIFSNRDEEHFDVELKGPVSAKIQVYLHPISDEESLKLLFQELGEFNKPWQGSKNWESLEGEFTVSITCSTLGQIVFNIFLRGLSGQSEEWKLNCNLESEFGQLRSISINANSFFSNEKNAK